MELRFLRGSDPGLSFPWLRPMWGDGLVAWDAVPGLKLTGIAVCPNVNEIRILNKAVGLVGNGAVEQLFAEHPLCAHRCASHAGR